MADYDAWAATGVVAGLQRWSEPDLGGDAGISVDDGTRGVRIASGMIQRQTFSIRQPDGREFQVNLPDGGMAVRDGEAASAIWVARKGASHGFCLLVMNHTTGAESRVDENVPHVRPDVGLIRTAKFGLLATVPAALVMLLWLFVPQGEGSVGPWAIVFGGAAAAITLFVIGLVVAKLVLDYLQADDAEKIWQIADDLAEEVRNAMRRPFRPVPHSSA